MANLESENTGKKPPLTPKSIIFQKFRKKAIYKVEEVEESSPNQCPGLAIQQKRPYLYRCWLQLPELSIVSGTFKRKKDAEQAAAEKAIEKLGICLQEKTPTVEEAWESLVDRLSFLFSCEFITSNHPLSGHLRAVMKRKDHLSGCVPISVIVMLDTKLCNLCKFINPGIESDPLLFMPIIVNAASRLPGSLLLWEDSLSLKSQHPYPPHVLQSLEIGESVLPDIFQIQALRIPSSKDVPVKPLALSISSGSYYLDVIAHALDIAEASRITVSKTIGKASSEIRLYFSVPKNYQSNLGQSSDPLGVHTQHEGSLNVRASYFAGQQVYGDAILAAVGYTWKSVDLFHEDVSLKTYFRLLINKIPTGVYKLSRDAILAVELPVVFTTRTNWRGFLPREILCTFCRQHGWAEPVFSIHSQSLEIPTELSCKKIKVESSGEEENGRLNVVTGTGESADPAGAVQCEVKIFSKHQDLVLHGFPAKAYKKTTDAIQNAALKIITWLSECIKENDAPREKLSSLAKKLDIHFYSENLVKDLTVLYMLHDFWICTAREEDVLKNSLTIGGHAVGGHPSSGSLVFINYSACLVKEGECIKEHLESNEDFEFEIGSGSVLPFLEGVITQISVGQSACFRVELPPEEYILAVADDPQTALSLLSSSKCTLEYCLTLTGVTEPLEDRMEQAFFSPPLSKQRVEYALQHIRGSCALSLVDFGCGSGSLLDSLLNYPTSLEKIVGVDISPKGLARAAKILHSKLKANVDMNAPTNRIRSAVLYDGSITSYDSRVCGFDIGTCLEVIEHMEEYEASLFGDVVLSTMCPKILIVSTPNYEYNVILQKSTPQSQEEDPEEKNQQQPYKFRNHDHKFEWTRAQFRDWATNLSRKHNYSIEFSGVGGGVDVEPGFASQIAVFRRIEEDPKDLGIAHPYEVIWEWSKQSAP